MSVITVDVRVLVGRRTGTGRCRIDGPTAVVDLPQLDGDRTVPTTVLPEWIAALVELAPCPRVAAPSTLITDRSRLDALLDGGSLAEVPHHWRGIFAAIVSSMHARWSVTVSPHGDALEVLDCRSAGFWAVQPCPPEAAGDDIPEDGALVSVTPTTPTAVWTWLSRLGDPFHFFGDPIPPH
jgi:hypothetical protein